MNKYPILDELQVPADVMESWQITVNLPAEIGGIPAAQIMRVHAGEIEVFVASHRPGNVYHSGEKAPLSTGLYCETVMSTRSELWGSTPTVKQKIFQTILDSRPVAPRSYWPSCDGSKKSNQRRNDSC